MQVVVEFENLESVLQRHPKLDCLKLPHPASCAPLVRQLSAQAPTVADGMGVVEAGVAASTLKAGRVRKAAAMERNCTVLFGFPCL